VYSVALSNSWSPVAHLHTETNGLVIEVSTLISNLLDIKIIIIFYLGEGKIS
jgi:hypothetical protein